MAIQAPAGPGQHTSQSKSYSIKVINSARKTEFVIQQLHGLNEIFVSVEELKTAIGEGCESAQVNTIGYVEPGHGAKGKQRWLISDADVAEMYKIYQNKKEILLWCYKKGPCGKGQKRARSPTNDDATHTGNPSKSSRYSNHLEKMTEVESIEDKLKEKHNRDDLKPFSDEQYRSWAHLIQMGKHASYDTPPDKPFWRNRKAAPTPTKSISSPVTISPGKRINLRGQCVEQLLRLHELLEKGGINKTEYDEMQESIMTEVRKF